MRQISDGKKKMCTYSSLRPQIPNVMKVMVSQNAMDARERLSHGSQFHRIEMRCMV